MKVDINSYSSKEVAKRLSIEPVTVRKYSQMLEDEGYIFKKDDKNWRQYSEEDIRFLEYLCNIKLNGKSLEESVKHVAGLYRSSLSISNSDTSLQDPKESVFSFMKAQQEFNLRLLEKIEQQEIRQIERDKNLVEVLRELQDTKKQIAASKQKKWWEFWK